MTSPEYSTGLVSDLARRAIAMFRTRRAANSSTAPGCSFALTPLLTKYQSPIAPTTIASPSSNRNALTTGRIRPSSLGLFRELRWIPEKFLPRLLGAEVVGLALIRRLRCRCRVGHQAVDRIHLLVVRLWRRMAGMRISALRCI